MQQNPAFSDKKMPESKSSKGEDLWNSYKELARVVHHYLSGENVNLMLHELECVLWKHKQNFFSLLQNPPKNAKSREELKKGMVDGITVRGIGHQILSKELYQETIILSDMYDMNEFVALDLLCTAQIQMSFYPGLPRGLVAIVLYYESRKSLVSSLRMLVQARTGIQWSVNIRPEVEKYITTYTDELFESGLFTRIFDLLKTLDVSKEIEKLQQNLALGGPKHRRHVIDTFKEIRVILADIVFTWSAQCGLPKTQTLALVTHLKEATIEEEASGKLDDVNLLLEVAFLSAVDLSILHAREDSEDAVQNLPIISQADFIEVVLAKLDASQGNWRCPGLQALSLFGMGVCLASLRLVPQHPQLQLAMEQQENVVDRAIDMNVFEFLHNVFLESGLLYREEFVLRRVHNLVTDFIIYMYQKVRELRMKADEVAKTMQVYVNEGIEPPGNLPMHFEQFMLSVAKLYATDPLNLELSVEFWSTVETKPPKMSSYRSVPRSVSLFKFVRFAGEVLPPTLFAPYLKMLTSLSSNAQSARHCFNMLKQASVHPNNTLSWDHFFLTFSRYYTTLHQEAPVSADTVYQRRALFHKGITPREMEGLHAVLGLIQTVAEQDDFSRLALCEHPAWAPLNVFLGLISCSIPIPLKADLLCSLAAFSKSYEIAAQMWENLEASQILVTVPSTSSFQPRGIQTELEEVESHFEEYPLTKALLRLLDVLTDSGIPRTLGAGPRKPGFDPYLNFLLNSVFLKFNVRSYKSPAEKWQVAEMCLKLFEKFLSQYEPDETDFPVGNKPPEFNPPPGFHLMLHSNTKSEYLNLLLYVIDEGTRHFDTYLPFQGKEHVTNCTLSAMNLINRSLALQTKFFTLLPSSATPVILTNLSKLLLIINPRTGKPDHFVNIVKYVGYQDALPKHTLAAVNIILQATQSPVIHSQFLNILLASDEAEAIRSSFVECLDASEDATGDTKIRILALIRQCLNYSAPNLSHYLLGFDLKREVSRMQFQLPGVLGFPRSCLHSLFSLLKLTCSSGLPAGVPALLESAYNLLYLLVADVNTSEPVLRYLRLDPKFLKNHLEYCFKYVNNGVAELNQMSWLLKTIAIELKIVCTSNQMHYLKQLTNLLVDLPALDSTTTESLLFASKTGAIPHDDTYITKSRQENLLLKLIQQFNFNIEEVVLPRWDYFDNASLESILNNCRTTGTPSLIDVKKLHHTLLTELNALQGGTALGQRQAIVQEIQKVLLHAVSVNAARASAAAIVRFVDSWRQVVEVLVTYVPIDVLSVQEQQVLDIQMLEGLLNKIVKVGLLPEVGEYLSGAVLLLLVNLRKCSRREERQRRIMVKPNEKISNPNVIQINSTSLKEIFVLLIEWIMASNTGHQKLRMNLYGALVTFLHLISIDDSAEVTVREEGSLYVSRLDSSKYEVPDGISYLQITTDIMSLLGEKMIEVVCQDCVGGHEISKMLAMASFSLLISTSGIIKWVVFMSGRGYLKHIVEGIMKSDDELRKLLEPTVVDLKPLYLFESKMSLLARIANTRVGAELLLEQKLLAYLSNMKVFDHHPEISKDVVEEEVLEDYIPPANKRYLKMWLPVFDVCNAILTSLGTENQSAVSQILYFLLNRTNALELILRAGNPSLSLMSLKELAVVTSVIARITNVDLLNLLQSNNTQNMSAFLHHVQKLMLNLLPRFLLTESVLKELLLSPVEERDSFRTSQRLLVAMQVLSNLLQYSKNLTTSNDVRNVALMFQPTLHDSLQRQYGKNKTPVYSEQVASLGIIVEHLLHAVKYCLKEKHTYNFLSGKLKEISEMNSIELKGLISHLPQTSNIYLMREQAVGFISDKYSMKKLEMEHCAFIIEHCVYVIWAHLDYYMLRAIPRARNFRLLNTSQSFSVDENLASAAEATWRVSTDDVSNLKQGLVSIFSDSFSKELIQTAEDAPELDKGLVESLLRKIKRLIQFVPVK